MASYSISYTDTTVTMTVTGLTSGQLVRLYVRLYDWSDVSDTLVDDYFESPGSTLTETFGGLSPNTKYAVNVQLAGSSSWIGAKSFTTKSSSTRPSNWSFYSTVQSGSSIALTAQEWNDFCARINEFASYCQVTQSTFTVVSSGTPISASIVNEARTAIGKLPGHGTLPSAVSAGDPIAASFFTALAAALNSIT